MILLFEQTRMWLENDVSIHSVQEFGRKMIEICKEEDKGKVDDARYIKKLLKNWYGGFIWFREDVGKESLIYFKSMAEYIIRESEREKRCTQESIDETKNRILKAAGNLIKAEIWEQIYANEYYPSIDDIAEKNWIPDNHQKLLRILIQSEVKVQSIGQAIITLFSRTAPTAILFGLSVELDHVFESKWLLDHLARLGFSVKSNEVKLYKQPVLSSSS